MSNLLKRLRTPWTKPEHTPIEFAEAADRIEQLEKVLAEWFDKTEWVQKTSDWQELGMHRADALKHRIEVLERTSQLKELNYQQAVDDLAVARRENAELRNATLEEAAVIVMESAYRSNGTSSYEHVAQKIRSLKT